MITDNDKFVKHLFYEFFVNLTASIYAFKYLENINTATYLFRQILYRKYTILTEIDKQEGHYMLGERIATFRKRAGISQAELAKRINVSTSTIGMYEQGRREPSIEVLIALSEEFNVTIDVLVKSNDVSAEAEIFPDCQELLARWLKGQVPAQISRDEFVVFCLAMLMSK